MVWSRLAKLWGASNSPPSLDVFCETRLWHSLTLEELYLIEKVDKNNGLTSKQAAKRLAKYGPNHIKQSNKTPLWRRLLNQINNLLIYILLVAALVTAYLAHYVDMTVIIAVILVNVWIGVAQEGKAEHALESIRQLLSFTATVLRDGQQSNLDAKLLVPGDIVLVKAGDKLAADMRIITANNLQVDGSILTGESFAEEKSPTQVDPKSTLAERHNMLYAGTLVTQGRAKALVIATAYHTEIGKITQQLSQPKQLDTPLLRQISIFGRWLTLAILALAALTFTIGCGYHQLPPETIFIAAVSLAVAAIPEGLPAIITIALAIGVSRMASCNAIIRRLPAVEALGSISVICTDKTGTLTHNELSVKSMVTLDKQFTATGSGFAAEGDVVDEEGRVVAISDYDNLRALLRAGLLCNEASMHLDKKHHWQHTGCAVDIALLSLAQKAGLNINAERGERPQSDLIPFDPRYKFMVSLHHDHFGHQYIFIKGAAEQILARCSTVVNGQNHQTIDHEFWQQQLTAMAQKGQRVLALALGPRLGKSRSLDLNQLGDDLTLLGLVGLQDQPRRETAAAVSACYRAGIAVKMITGDHHLTAEAVANDIGLELGSGVITGQQLEQLTDDELIACVNQHHVFARTSPEHKLRIVHALQANDEVVAMTGDGVNDAPALRQADVGIAMGKQGSETAKEVAEMVLADDNFASIVSGIKQGRTAFDNIKKALFFILPTNGAQAFNVVIAIALAQMLPITALQILWVNTVTAVTLALALAFEESEPSVLDRLPRDPIEPILSRFMLWRIGFVSLLLVAATYIGFHAGLATGLSLEQARAAAVNMLVVGEIAYLFNCRSLLTSTFNWHQFGRSRIFWFCILTVVLLQALFTYQPIMNDVFATAALPASCVLCIAAVGAVIFLIVELEKAVWRYLANCFEDCFGRVVAPKSRR